MGGSRRPVPHVNAAISNLMFISPCNCDVRCLLVLLAPMNVSSPPLPHLERVMVLGPETGSEKMVRRTKSLSVPPLVFGREPIVIRALIERLHGTKRSRRRSTGIGHPTETLEWGPGTRYEASGLQLKFFVRLTKPETGWYCR